MRRLLLEVIFALSLTLAAIISLAVGARASDVVVKDAFARASATPSSEVGAVYFTIENATAEADLLTAMTTPVAGMAHLHRTVTDGDVAKMEGLDGLEIPARASVELKPGGLHVMLMGLKRPLKEGEQFSLHLVFAKAGDVEVTVPVLGVAAQAVGSSGD